MGVARTVVIKAVESFALFLLSVKENVMKVFTFWDVKVSTSLTVPEGFELLIIRNSITFTSCPMR